MTKRVFRDAPKPTEGVHITALKADLEDVQNECIAVRADNARLREQLQDCTLFIRQACEQKILDRTECKPLLKQWEAALAKGE